MTWLVILLIVLLTLFLTCPNLRRARTADWHGQPFAHRGLHDAKAGVIENTLPAFEAACRKGYGIELDIQFSADGEVVVFHDDDLKRLCGDARRVCDVPLAELQALPLGGVEGAHIPTLAAVLERVNGSVPLLIELKTGSRNARLCAALMARLEGYRGRYLVESFNPLIVRWFRKNAPQVVRGQLVCPMREYRPKANGAAAFAMAGLLFNALTRPDFVAYNANARRFFSPHFQRFAFRTPMAAWTVRSAPMAKLIEARGEMPIFEGIDP